MILGDSASAHFHIPQNYFRPNYWKTPDNTNLFKNLLGLIIDEGDFPMTSWGTGWDSIENWRNEIVDDETEVMPEVVSIYKYMLEENKCNNNDFQNVAMNGRASGSMFSHIKGATRNQDFDKPMIVILSLIVRW